MARGQGRSKVWLPALMLVAWAPWGCTRSGFVGSGDARVDARGGDVAADRAVPALDGRQTDRPRDGRPADVSTAKDASRDWAPQKDQPAKDQAQKKDLPPKDQAQKKDLPVKDLAPPDKKKGSDIGSLPTGAYVVAPGITYSCALGIVSFNITTASFVYTSGKPTVTVGPQGPGGGCNVLTSTTAFPSAFSVTCTYAGICTETYTLSGTFSGSTSWTGTFTATYVGSCMNCTNQSWNVTGTRP